jgi:hypothetical protein
VYTPVSPSVLRITEAAVDLCRILWVIDRGVYDTYSDDTGLKVMARFGPVITTEGRALDEIAEAVTAETPHGVAVFDDSGQILAARLAERVGLRFHSEAVVERLTDKIAQRSALRSAGFPVPRFWLVPSCSPASVADDIAREATYPLVVKPRRGSASRDAYRADNAASLRIALGACRGEDMIVETYLPDPVALSDAGAEFADFVSVESVIQDGHVEHLAVTGRFPLAVPFRGSGMFIPSNLKPDITSEVMDLAGDSALALGVRTGFMHTEIKITPDGPRIVELNGRVGGGVPDILRLLGGPSLISWQMRLSLGMPLPLHEMPVFDRIGFYLWHQPPVTATEITAVVGLDVVADLPGVHEVRSVRRAGERVDWRAGGVGHVFGVGGVVADTEQLIQLRHQILSTTTVEYR